MKAVTDALLRRSGVADVRVDLQANLVHIEPDRRVAFPLRSIPDAIAAAGFKPGPMTITANGAFEGTGGGRAFRITGWPDALPADPALAADDDGAVRAGVDWRAEPTRLRAVDSD